MRTEVAELPNTGDVAGHDLPALVQAAWDDPERLARVISDALNAGRAGEVVDAARRLQEIDPYPEHSANVLALVLRTCADHEGAEQVLLDHLRTHGGDAETWFNLAPLAAWRGNPADVDAALNNALGFDPNHAAALDWGFRHHQRSEGAEEAIQWLWKHSAGSWRAHVMLGRQALEWGEQERAMEYFVAAARIAPHEPGPLTEAARALMDAGHPVQLIDFVMSRWRGPNGPQPLMIAIEASLQLGNAAEAAFAIGRLRGIPVPEELRPQAAELEQRVQLACEQAGI